MKRNLYERGACLIQKFFNCTRTFCTSLIAAMIASFLCAGFMPVYEQYPAPIFKKNLKYSIEANTSCFDSETRNAKGNEIKSFLKSGDFICSQNGKYKFTMLSNSLCFTEQLDAEQPERRKGCMDIPTVASINYGLPPPASILEFGLNSSGNLGMSIRCRNAHENKNVSVSTIMHFESTAKKSLVLDDDGKLKVIDESKRELWNNLSGPTEFVVSRDYTPCNYFDPPNPQNVTSSYPTPPVKYGTYYTKYAPIIPDINFDMLGTPSVVDEKFQLALNQYWLMIRMLKSESDKAKLKDIRVFLMSKEDHPPQMTFFYYPSQPQSYNEYLEVLNRQLRGSTFNGGSYGGGSLLITDEMICAKGVASNPADNNYRGLDQVVHEMGHKFDYVLKLKTRAATIDGVRYTGLYDLIQKNHLNPDPDNYNDEEVIAYAFQYFFTQCYTCANSKTDPSGPDKMSPLIRKYFEDQIFKSVPPEDAIIRCPYWTE